MTTPPAPFTPALPALAATNPAIIHLYCRVSSDEQKNYGSSLDVQERDLIAFVERHFPNAQIRVWKEGGVSGNKRVARRRVGSDMLAALQPGDLVICTKQDRLFRNNVDAQVTLEDFTEQGIHLALLDVAPNETITNNPEKRFMFDINSVIAQRERNLGSERVKAINADKRRRGLAVGSIPRFGYRFEGEKPNRLEVPDERDHPILQHALQRIGESAALRQIARELTARGDRNRNGTPFKPSQISRMGVLAGLLEAKTSSRSDKIKTGLARAKAAGWEPGNPEARAASKRGNAALLARQKAKDREIRPTIEKYIAEVGANYRAVCRCLNRDGVATYSTRGRWHPATVRDLMIRLKLYTKNLGGRPRKVDPHTEIDATGSPWRSRRQKLERRVAELYVQRLKVQEIVIRLQVTEKFVRRVLDHFDLPVGRDRAAAKADDIRELWEKGSSLKQISAQTGLSVRTISRFKKRAKLDRLDILNLEPARIDAAIIEVIPLINELYLQGFKTVEVPHYLNNPGENRRPVANPFNAAAPWVANTVQRVRRRAAAIQTKQAAAGVAPIGLVPPPITSDRLPRLKPAPARSAPTTAAMPQLQQPPIAAPAPRRSRGRPRSDQFLLRHLPLMLKLKGEGYFTDEGIAREFNRRGIAYIGGKLWGVDAVKRAFKLRPLAVEIEQSMIEVAALPAMLPHRNPAGRPTLVEYRRQFAPLVKQLIGRGLTTNEVVAELNARKLPDAGGRFWTYNSVTFTKRIEINESEAENPTPPAPVTAADASELRRQWMVEEWRVERCIAGWDNSAEIALLYADFYGWASEFGEDPPAIRDFSRTLLAFGDEVVRWKDGKRSGVYGLALIEQAPASEGSSAVLVDPHPASDDPAPASVDPHPALVDPPAIPRFLPVSPIAPLPGEPFTTSPTPQSLGPVQQVVYHWRAQRCLRGRHFTVSTKDLHTDFLGWAAAVDIQPMSERLLVINLMSLGDVEAWRDWKSGRRGFRGLRLITSDDQVAARTEPPPIATPPDSEVSPIAFVKRWCDNRCRLGDFEDKTTSAVLYDDFRNWLIESGRDDYPEYRVFGRELATFNFPKWIEPGTGRHGYRRIALNAAPPPSLSDHLFERRPDRAKSTPPGPPAGYDPAFVAEVRADPVAVWMRHRCLFAPGARTKYHLLRADFRDWVRPILGEVPRRMRLTQTAAALGHKIAFDPADGAGEFQDIALSDAPDAAGPASVEPAQRRPASGNQEE